MRRGGEVRRGAEGGERGAGWARALCLALCLASGLALGGCGGEPPPPWEQVDGAEATRGFLRALATRDMETAWAFLLEEDRAALEASASRVEALGGGAVTRAPWTLLSTGHIAASASEVASVAVEADAADAADAAGAAGERMVARVALHSGRSFDVGLVRRGARWYVDLPLTAPGESGEGGGSQGHE